MTGWFRSHHGAPTDIKFRVVARLATDRIRDLSSRLPFEGNGAPQRNSVSDVSQRAAVSSSLHDPSTVTAGHVVACFWAILDYASQHEDRGSVTGFDVESVAAFYDWAPSLVEAVLWALRERKLIVNEKLRSWEKRQTGANDYSTPRVRAYRERQRSGSETEGETDETQIDREREREIERKKDARESKVIDDYFDQFWRMYPHKVAKAYARKVFPKAFERAGSWLTMREGLKRYVADKPADRSWCNPSTWLNEDRWEDRPAHVNGAADPPLVPSSRI